MDETEEERRRSPRIIVLLPLIEDFEGRGRGLRLVFGARKLAVVGAIPPPTRASPPLPPA